MTQARLQRVSRAGPQGVFLQPTAPILKKNNAADCLRSGDHRPQGVMQKVPR